MPVSNGKHFTEKPPLAPWTAGVRDVGPKDGEGCVFCAAFRDGVEGTVVAVAWGVVVVVLVVVTSGVAVSCGDVVRWEHCGVWWRPRMEVEMMVSAEV